MKVVHNDLVVLANNATWACTDSKLIFIDDDFYNLPNNVKKFVLAHEKGHVVLKHSVYAENNWFNESMADNYAFEHVGVEPTKEFISIAEELIVENDVDDTVFNFRLSKLKHMVNVKETTKTIINSGDKERIDSLLEMFNEVINIFDGGK